MAAVKKEGSPIITSSEISLPNKKTQPKQNFSEFRWLFYGTKKIGKTALLSQVPNTLFLACEKGDNAQELYSVETFTWSAILKTLALLKQGNHNYKHVVIDTADVAFDHLIRHICKENGVETINEGSLSYGQGINKSRLHFIRAMNEFVYAGLARTILLHERRIEIQDNIGRTTEKITPLISDKKIEEYINSDVDGIIYMFYHKNKRYMQVRGTNGVEAGTRMSHYKFLTPTGEPVFCVPMGDSQEEAWKNLQIAFANKQEKTFEEVAK